jgi:hypothetical protein
MTDGTTHCPSPDGTGIHEVDLIKAAAKAAYVERRAQEYPGVPYQVPFDTDMKEHS